MKGQSLSVVYLARGADLDSQNLFLRFVESYQRFGAGIAHKLLVVFKGFDSHPELQIARSIFGRIDARELFLDDDTGFDIAAYRRAALTDDSNYICFLNGHSHIVAHDWLAKLYSNACGLEICMVGATASFESLRGLGDRFPPFPNTHLRSNAFLMRRHLFLAMTENCHISNKKDAWLAESGDRSFTRFVYSQGGSVILVGANGRGYSPEFWPRSRCFRFADQENLLVADNVTQLFALSTMQERSALVADTWGHFAKRGRWSH